jgi:CDGSH-type Zn-finger protein
MYFITTKLVVIICLLIGFIVKQKVFIEKNGPYSVSGGIPLAKEISVPNEKGEIEKWKTVEKYPTKERYTICRCGGSKNKPYCDTSHKINKFNGTETASTKDYLEQSEKITGPDLELTDAGDLCSGARFCHRSGGTWDNTRDSDNPEAKKIAVETACNCPSGRLVAWDKKTGEAIEPELKPCIGILEDPQKKLSGPVWLKGKIDLESENGIKYEKRNRITLCRCGNSNNKPFCDGRHLDTGFNDGDLRLK